MYENHNERLDDYFRIEKIVLLSKALLRRQNLASISFKF